MGIELTTSGQLLAAATKIHRLFVFRFSDLKGF
jgi:hypothetical protein